MGKELLIGLTEAGVIHIDADGLCREAHPFHARGTTEPTLRTISTVIFSPTPPRQRPIPPELGLMSYSQTMTLQSASTYSFQWLGMFDMVGSRQSTPSCPQ